MQVGAQREGQKKLPNPYDHETFATIFFSPGMEYYTQVLVKKCQSANF